MPNFSEFNLDRWHCIFRISKTNNELHMIWSWHFNLGLIIRYKHKNCEDFIVVNTRSNFRIVRYHCEEFIAVNTRSNSRIVRYDCEDFIVVKTRSNSRIARYDCKDFIVVNTRSNSRIVRYDCEDFIVVSTRSNSRIVRYDCEDFIVVNTRSNSRIVRYDFEETVTSLAKAEYYYMVIIYHSLFYKQKQLNSKEKFRCIFHVLVIKQMYFIMLEN